MRTTKHLGCKIGDQICGLNDDIALVLSQSTYLHVSTFYPFFVRVSSIFPFLFLFEWLL